jgi:hypothetical protein
MLPKGRRYRSIWHEIADAARMAVICVSLTLLACGIFLPLGRLTWQALLVQLLIVLAVLLKGLRLRLRALVVLTASLSLLLSLVLRVRALDGAGAEFVRHLPAERSFSFLNKLLPEEDGVYLGMAFLSLVGGVSRSEYSGFQGAMEEGYRGLRSEIGDIETPLISTMLFAEGSQSFDLVHFPARRESGKGALIFLHGVGGNWTLLCWIVAESVRDLGYSTYCPSTGVFGAWARGEGPEIFKLTLEEVKKQGDGRIFLGGVSAGSVGAVPLALAHERELDGVFLISGIGVGIAELSIPSILVTGKDDVRFTPDIVNWVLSTGQPEAERFEHHWLSGDHMAMIKQKAEVQHLISAWISKRVRDNPASPGVNATIQP